MTSSFWIILLAVLSYGLVHSLLASLRAKEVARRWFGSKADRWYRLAYNFIAVITLLPIMALPALLSDKQLYRIPFPWIIGSLVIQFLAAITLILALRQTGISSFLGLQQLLLPEDTSPPRLVTKGLYRYVRHPFYPSGFVFIWLIPIMTWNLLAINIGLTIYIFIGAHFEEKKLLGEFGEAYVEYQRSTPMLVPGLRFGKTKPRR